MNNLTDAKPQQQHPQGTNVAEIVPAARQLHADSGISDNEFYHYDTPLTGRHETEALMAAGFSGVEVLGSWGATHTLRAKR